MTTLALRSLRLRLGARYPQAVLTALFLAGLPVALAGVGLLLLYQDVPGDALARIVAAVLVLGVAEALLSRRLAERLLAPARPWLAGRRDGDVTVRAWCALAGLPQDFLSTRRALAVLANVVPISVFVTWQLGLSAASLPVIAAGAAVVLAYGVLLRFLGMELLMRPVLEEVSLGLPDGAALGGTRLSLRTKLLVAVPAINVITGVVVSALVAARSGGDLGDLGWGVLFALAVSGTLSLELTLLLSRSVVDQVDALREVTRRVAAGELDARAPVVTTDESGALAGSLNQMISALAERERLREALGAYVDPAVVDRVLAEGTQLEGEEVEVSVLFIDIRGFTELAERLSARAVVVQLNAFYGRVVPVLERHGGHANMFIGDGLLAVFGAPDRLADHADRAVAAAIDVAEGVRHAYGDALRIGIGVSSGRVLAGTVGGGGHVAFTVIGDAVNTASRVEKITRETGDDVLVTEATRRLLVDDHGGFAERPKVVLRGKRQAVRLYAPLRAAASPVPA
jgi:class 3 adenylate cyclase